MCFIVFLNYTLTSTKYLLSRLDKADLGDTKGGGIDDASAQDLEVELAFDP